MSHLRNLILDYKYISRWKKVHITDKRYNLTWGEKPSNYGRKMIYRNPAFFRNSLLADLQ